MNGQNPIPNNKGAQLIYDRTAADGVSVYFHKWVGGSSKSGGIVEDNGDNPMHFPKSRAANIAGLDLPAEFGTDSNYPVDVRAFDPRGKSSIYKGGVNMFGIYTSNIGSIGPFASGTVTFEGYIEGWGYTTLESSINAESSWINFSASRGVMYGEYQGEGIISPLSLLGSGTDINSGIKFFESSAWFSLDDAGNTTWAGSASGIGVGFSHGSKVSSSFSKTKMTYPSLSKNTKNKIEIYESNSKN